MPEPTGSTRWWENYLVRYFLPSLVGMLIVLWLQRYSGAALYIPPFLPNGSGDINTGSLVLWLLFGSLYSYVASYPALVFHATRVLDFEDVLGRIAKFPYWLLNPYISCVVFGMAAAVIAMFDVRRGAIWLVAGFSAIQILRISLVAFRFGDFGLKKDLKGRFAANLAYAYMRKLSQRRGITTTDKIEPDEAMKQKGVKESVVTRKDERDMVDSYRHLREHGNTALIVFLELALCPVLYLQLEYQDGPSNKIWFAMLLAMWVLPSVLIHGFAQQLERRYSWFKFSFSNRGDNDLKQSN